MLFSGFTIFWVINLRLCRSMWVWLLNRGRGCVSVVRLGGRRAARVTMLGEWCRRFGRRAAAIKGCERAASGEWWGYFL